MTYINLNFNPNQKLSIQYRVSIIIISIFYGAILLSLPMDAIMDRDNYLIYAEFSNEIILKYVYDGWLPLLSNEPVWLGLNIFLSFFLTPEQTVRALIGIPAIITAYLVLKTNPKYFLFLVLILLIPNVIKNNIVHLRQGLAISIFFFAIFNKKKSNQHLLIALTPFIHSSFFIVILLLSISAILQIFNLSLKVKIFIFAFISLFLCLGLGFFSSLLQSRQSETYDFSMTDVSGFGFVFWLIILTLYLLEAKSFTHKFDFIIELLVFYLVGYFLIDVTARIFESTIIFVLLAGIYLTKWRKQAFIQLFVLYTLVFYILRIDQAWLGWGI